jgi:hypothetical protein
VEQSPFIHATGQVVDNTMRRRSSQPRVADPDIFDEEYDDIWPSQKSSSIRRYRSDVQMETGRAQTDEQWSTTAAHPRTRSAVPARRTAAQSTSRRQVDTDDIVVSANRTMIHEPWRIHWTVLAGLALLLMLLGWTLLTGVAHWWQIAQDDLRYGRPRTFQMDQVVGHNDSVANPSHFLALNLNRHVEVIEFPGGDATNAKVYLGPILVGPDQDLAPVTLTFKDVNHDGKLDMLINVQDSHFIFLNADGQFHTPPAGEQLQP